MKPLVETLAAALRESGFSQSPGALDHARELSEQVEALTERIDEFERAQAFERKLLAGRSEAGSGRR